MTLEELKDEAKKHGFRLVKEYPYISLSPCVCGHKRIASPMIYGGNKTPYFHRCNKCGFASAPARTKHEARNKWNECVERAKEKNDEG